MNNDLENSFGASAIQQMELTLMTALGWRMNSTTPFSYIQYLTTHDVDLTQRVTQLLLNALLGTALINLFIGVLLFYIYN